MAHPVSEFGPLLRTLRRRVGLSQLTLALAAETSQRHLSFLETGRAQPGRAVAMRLAAALKLARPEARALLAAGGFAPDADDRPASPDQWAAVMAVLRAYGPYPALAMTVEGDVIAANPALDSLLALIEEPEALWRRTCGDGPRNLYRLTFHPEGLIGALVNRNAVAQASLGRAQAEAHASPRLADLIASCAGWLGWRAGRCDAGLAIHGPTQIERYAVGGRLLSFMATTTTIGAPFDAADGGGIRVEAYLPVDSETEAATLSA